MGAELPQGGRPPWTPAARTDTPGSPETLATPGDPFRRGTLARRLLVRVVALVAAAALLLSALTTLATEQLLVSQVDRQLDAVTDRLRRDPDGRGYGPGPRGGLLQPGQPIGTLYSAYSTDGSSLTAARLA